MSVSEHFRAGRNRFGEYSGNLYDHPKVTIEVGDARSYVARSKARFDIIQASLVDTFAATSAGAFALSENSLYTREAFVDYYNHLTEDGVLTLSRWYLDERPAETLRLVSLALGGWEAAGVSDPGGHIIVIANRELVRSTEGMATIIIKRSPFTLDEIGMLLGVSEKMGFDVLYAPALPTSGPVHDLVVAEARQVLIDAYPLDISIPTDDRPFFFNLVRYQDLLAGNTILSEAYSTAQQSAWVLIVMLFFTMLLSVAFVFAPLLWLERSRSAGRPASRFFIYIAMLGVGFMLLELPTVQRLTVYLGSPTYSLTVEERTPLWKQVQLGRIEPVDGDVHTERFRFAIDYLMQAGYEHYEISSFALEGYRSIHNHRYWTHHNYIGCGPSAHSFWWRGLPARRWSNVRNLNRYQAFLAGHTRPIEVQEELSLDVLAREYVMLRLRTSDGLDLDVLENRYGVDLLLDRIDELAFLEESNFIEPIRNQIVRLTELGKTVCDSVTERLMPKEN